MINAFRILGRSVLKKAGFYETDDAIQKKEIFLKLQSIVPHHSGDQCDRAISINFNTGKGKFEFELDKEISLENRDYFFAFSVGAPRDRKKFLSTNNILCFYGKVFSDTLEYIEDKRNKKKSGEWFSENISSDYDKMVEMLRDQFFIMDGKELILNKSMICKEDKPLLSQIEDSLVENQKDKSKPISTEALFNTFLNKKHFNCDSKNTKKFPPIFFAKINGKHIIEDDNLKKSYINLVYYDLFERFLIENFISEKTCHICGNKTDVIGEIPFQMKFYGTTNNLYFENLLKKDAYKAFSICADCLREVLTGMKYVITELRDFILGVSCYLLPSIEEEDSDYGKTYKSIIKTLTTKKESYQDDLYEVDDLVKKANRKDIHFSLLFFDSPPGSQAFDIIKLIANIEYRGLAQKLSYFFEFNKFYELAMLKGFNRISIGDIRYLLFPSKFSHSKSDTRLFRKDILDLFESFLQGYSINYHSLIKRFTNIYRLRFHGNKTDELSPFKMVLILSIFHKISPLKGVNDMKGKKETEIQKEEYKRFFETHKEIYGDNYFRQGLFLLGTVINGIVREQMKKIKKKAGVENKAKQNSTESKKIKLSSTFLKKINYSGIPARRVINLVNDVQNYVQIYDVFEEPGVWGNLTDRLQGIETSEMKGEEIVFYILTGISYAKYLGLIHNLKKEGE